MTVSDYLTRTREKIGDAVQPYRFPESEVRASLQQALWRARQFRPSLCYSEGELIEADKDINFLTASLSLSVRAELDRCSDGIALLAAARALLNDNADTLNVGLAEKWEAKGMTIIMS